MIFCWTNMNDSGDRLDMMVFVGWNSNKTPVLPWHLSLLRWYPRRWCSPHSWNRKGKGGTHVHPAVETHTLTYTKWKVQQKFPFFCDFYVNGVSSFLPKKHLLLVFLCHPFGHVTAFANDQVLNLLQQMDLSIDRHALDIPLKFLVAAWKVEATDLDFEVPAVYVAGWWEIQKKKPSFWSFLLFFFHTTKRFGENSFQNLKTVYTPTI